MKGADFIKFLLSLIVVWNHTGNNSLFGLVGRAVPVFFIFSGFFLFRKLEVKNFIGAKPILLGWLNKNLYLYLIWVLIYLPFSCYGFYVDSVSASRALIAWTRNVLFVGQNFYSWHLWYMVGLLQAGVIIYAGKRLKCSCYLYAFFAVTLYILPRLIDFNQFPLYNKLFVSTANGFFIGFPFMVVGGLFQHLFHKIKGWNKNEWQYQWGIVFRYFSVVIYFSHMFWVAIFRFLHPIERGLRLWCVTIACALLFAIVLLFIPKVQKLLLGRVYCSCVSS